MNVALFISDGVGIRNFVFTDFLHKLPDSDDRAVVLYQAPDELLPQLQRGLNGRTDWRSLVPYRPKVLDEFLQGALSFAHMYWVDTIAMRRRLARKLKGSPSRRAFQKAKRFAGRLSGSPRGIRTLESWLDSVTKDMPEIDEYCRIFEELKPTVLFCSKQQNVEAIPAVLAARRMGIPTASFIFSWDNLTSKGRIVAQFDHYLVWSELMKTELLRYYPEVPESSIHIVGTPQFEPYADDSLLWSREEFCKRIGADPERPLICYSGGDPGTAPEDPEHVRVLLERIREGAIRGNPQVVLRPVPVDDGERYRQVREQFPELIYSPPLWKHPDQGYWKMHTPLREDVQLLANMTKHADLNINLGSTMTLDFAIHDRPVVNIAFDVADPPIFGQPLFEFYYHYDHFQPVIELGASRIAKSQKEFVDHINAYLDDPSLDREGRRKLTELQVGVPIGQANQRVHEVLRQISL